MANYPSSFKPFSTTDLIRIGSRYDGGYVIPERVTKVAKSLLSFGLSDEWSFEAEFVRRAGCDVVCFDPSVTTGFWLKRFVQHVVKGSATLDYHRVLRAFRFISYSRFFNGPHRKHVKRAIGYSYNGGVDLAEALIMSSTRVPYFLKIDIEGWEYRIIDDIAAARSDLCGIAIEFHDVDINEQHVKDFIDRVSDQLILVHFHPNTRTQFGRDKLALAVEMTFMNRSLLLPGESLVFRSLPIEGIDWPNAPGEQHTAVSFGD